MRSLRTLLVTAVLVSSLGACEKKPQATADPPKSAAAPPSPAPPAPAPPASEGTPMTKPLATDEVTVLAKGSNDLAFDLYGRMKASAGNLAFAPASISAALAMTYGGAKGETAAQMKKTLHFTADPPATMTSWGGLTKTLADPARPMKLRVANRLFGEKTYTFEAPYLAATKDAFGAPLEPVDFKTAFEPARAWINGWVEEQTEKRIKDLLPARSLNGDTRLVLVNAIYFLAEWEEPFEKERTRDEPFNLTATTKKNVPTMKRTEHLPIAKVPGASVLELPYKGSTSMLVVLPERVDGLADVEKSLSSAALASWRSALKVENVRVELPRFEVNPAASLALAKELTALGMPDAFDREKADFTAMAHPPDPRDRLYIGEVFHKAFVKTDEKGTEAAGATAVVMARAGGVPQKPIDFLVDRPFLFFIVDKPSSLVLFMGRVTEP
ncbi:MAG: serpin family protein [Labilithrix sp.]|nr:serpin family protein [Labilithrix sp.]MCW5817233.1 serpin family protein [Labilithrix sp.]